MSTLLEVGIDEIADYVSEKYNRALEFYAEMIADSDNNEDTIAEQVDGAVSMILGCESDDMGRKVKYDDDLVDKLTDVVYDMIVCEDEE